MHTVSGVSLRRCAVTCCCEGSGFVSPLSRSERGSGEPYRSDPFYSGIRRQPAPGTGFGPQGASDSTRDRFTTTAATRATHVRHRIPAHLASSAHPSTAEVYGGPQGPKQGPALRRRFTAPHRTGGAKLMRETMHQLWTKRICAQLHQTVARAHSAV